MKSKCHGNYIYSVLMSVYFKENAEYLRTAMNSIWNQTVKTDDFVLVCDGTLTPELDALIEEMKEKYPAVLHVVRLEQNTGLGNALNAGLKHCKNEIVARMDSDDISREDRCERQLNIFNNNPEFSIISGTVEEFSQDHNVIEACRVLPEKQDDILQFAKKRNPFNHPCVMYKKSAVYAAGGYADFFLLEDYYLWIRMLQKGAIGYNIQSPLLWMRAGAAMYKRRASWKYAKSQKNLFKYMKDCKMINTNQYLSSVITRFAFSLMPNKIRKALFISIIRS